MLFGNTIPHSLIEINHNPHTVFDPQVISDLGRLVRSPTLLGQILRTLIYYTRNSTAARRDDDLSILLLVSTAIAESYREPER